MKSPAKDAECNPQVSASQHRISARLFYAIIVCGVFLGVFTFGLGGWTYLRFGDQRPTGHRIWEGMAEFFVVPICIMIGATFGGLTGVGAAVLADLRYRSNSKT